MLKEKIQEYFNQYPQLRVLFFFDEEEEYRDEVDQLDFEDIHILEYADNSFSLKWKLVSEMKHEKVFLYLPMPQPTTQDQLQGFPLLGLMVANKVLQLDDVGAFMEKYRLKRHQKSLVSQYMQELKYSGVQEVCAPILTASNFQEPALQRGLLSSFLKFKQPENWGLITAKLLLLSDPSESKEWNRVYKKVINLDMEQAIRKNIQRVTGISISSLSQGHLKKVAQGVLYNKLTQGIELKESEDPYADLKVQDSNQITQLNQMLHEVSRSSFADSFSELMGSLSDKIKGERLVKVYGEDTDFVEYTTSMIWAILKSLLPFIKEAPSRFIKRIESISLQDSIDPLVRDYINYFIQVAKVHNSIQEHSHYILDRPENYISEYIEGGYKVDFSYRKAIKIFRILDHSILPGDIPLQQTHSDLNKDYEYHTDQLNREWLKCLDQFEFDYSSVNAPKQFEFYDTEVAQTDQKVVVIISDALRYEAGQELLSQMHGDPKNTAEIRYMLASIPSKTSVGMCQLLPGKKQFNSGSPSADGTSTSGTNNRGAILSAYNTDSRAIQFSELEGMDQSEQREVFKTQIVYVYHDVIDATGDKKSSERRTFDVVDDAIGELKRFVKSLHATLNVSKVLITADHGFHYNDREIQEKEKENLPVTEAIQTHNRYVLTTEKQELELGYSIPLKSTSTFDDEVWVNIPYSVNRYKKQGVGHQFVHGGGTLQEVVVPLIESSRKRVEVTKKVKPMLVNRDTLRVVSNILKVNLLQESAVSRTEKERTIKIGLYVDNKLVSNEETVVLNSTSEAPSERMTRKDLVLSPDASNVSVLKLKIFDVEDLLNPVIEELVQNSTLIQTDF